MGLHGSTSPSSLSVITKTLSCLLSCSLSQLQFIFIANIPADRQIGRQEDPVSRFLFFFSSSSFYARVIRRCVVHSKDIYLFNKSQGPARRQATGSYLPAQKLECGESGVPDRNKDWLVYHTKNIPIWIGNLLQSPSFFSSFPLALALLCFLFFFPPDCSVLIPVHLLSSNSLLSNLLQVSIGKVYTRERGRERKREDDQEIQFRLDPSKWLGLIGQTGGWPTVHSVDTFDQSTLVPRRSERAHDSLRRFVLALLREYQSASPQLIRD